MLTSPLLSFHFHLALLKNDVMASMVTWPPLPAALPLPLLLLLGALPDTVTASARLLLPTILLLPNPGRAGCCGEYKLRSSLSNGANLEAELLVRSTMSYALLPFPLTPADANVFVTVLRGLCAGGLTVKDSGRGDFGGFLLGAPPVLLPVRVGLQSLHPPLAELLVLMGLQLVLVLLRLDLMGLAMSGLLAASALLLLLLLLFLLFSGLPLPLCAPQVWA